MHLDRAPRVTERGSRAEVHHAVEATAFRLCANCIYPFGRQKFSPGSERDVERWITELATALLAWNHNSAERVWTSKRARRTLEISVGDRRTNRAGRDRRTNRIESRRNDLDGEAMHFSQRRKHCRVPLPTTTEAVVVTDDELTHAVALAQ